MHRISRKSLKEVDPQFFPSHLKTSCILMPPIRKVLENMTQIHFTSFSKV